MLPQISDLSREYFNHWEFSVSVMPLHFVNLMNLYIKKWKRLSYKMAEKMAYFKCKST